MQDLYAELDSRAQSIRYAYSIHSIFERIEHDEILVILIPARYPFLDHIKNHVYFEAADPLVNAKSGCIGRLKNVPIVINVVHPPKQTKPQLIYKIDAHAVRIMENLIKANFHNDGGRVEFICVKN